LKNIYINNPDQVPEHLRDLSHINGLEDSFVKEAKELAVEALQNAMKRDSASGDGIMIVIIDKNGVHESEKMKVVPTLK